jgi:hypothetical protein
MAAGSAATLCFACPAPAVFDDRLGNHSTREERQCRDDDDVVEVANDGEKIRDEVERQQGLPNRQAEEQLRRLRRAAIFEHELVYSDLALEGSSCSL